MPPILASKTLGIVSISSCNISASSWRVRSGILPLKEINIIGQKFKKLLSEQKSQGASIAAYGAPTKATTLCYHFGIGPEFIDFIVDDNPLKQGMLSPGKHIPVLSSEQIYEQKPDFVVILAWNFAESIISNHKKYLMEGGKFILPMPEPQIVI